MPSRYSIQALRVFSIILKWVVATFVATVILITGWNLLTQEAIKFLVVWMGVLWCALMLMTVRYLVSTASEFTLPPLKMATFSWKPKGQDAIAGAAASPRIFETESAKRSYSSHVGKPSDLQGRAEAAMRQRLDNPKDLDGVRKAIEHARQMGWWPWLSASLWSGSMRSTASDVLMVWLENGVQMAAYDDYSYDPLVFRCISTYEQPRTLNTRLLDALLAAGADIHALDLADRNLFDRLLNDAVEHADSMMRSGAIKVNFQVVAGLKIILDHGVVPSDGAIDRLRRLSECAEPAEATSLLKLAADLECSMMETNTASVERGFAKPSSRL